MIRAPDLAAIQAAEARVAQSWQNTRDGLHRANVAIRATLAKPSTLALVVGVTGVLGFWLARRKQPQPTLSVDKTGAANASPTLALVWAFIVRYGIQGFPFIVEQVRMVRRQFAARADAEMSKFPDISCSP